MLLAVELIRTDGGTQPRALLNPEVATDYAEAMAGGAVFPPVTVFYDGEAHWLADGFHRITAAKALGLAEIDCDVRQGTRRDAVWHSVGANASHGYPRNNADKRRAVLTLLNDSEWAKYSDREIARQCGVSAPLVASLRPVAPPVTVNSYSETAPRTFTTKHGTTATMNTANIGRSPAPRVDRSFSQVEYPEETDPGPPPLTAATDPRLAHSEIYHALRAIGAAIDALSFDGGEAADLFPRGVEHSLVDDDVERWAVWLAEFSARWLELKPERQRRIEKSRAFYSNFASDHANT